MSAKIHLTKAYVWVRLIHFETEPALTTGKSFIRGSNSKIRAKLLVKGNHKLGKISMFFKIYYILFK